MHSFAESLDGAKQNTLAQAAWISAFAALTAIGAQIEIPHEPVPYTLQTFFVLLGGAFLGSRNGSASQLLYLVIGLAGAPVFAGGSGGALRLFGPSGGYLLSFPVAALLVGYLVQQRRGYHWTLMAMFLGLLVIFGCGASFLNFFYLHNIKQVVVSGFLIFSWWDLLKLTAATAIYNEFAKRFRSLPERPEFK
jgi:biotin transport system substrate-specific component